MMYMISSVCTATKPKKQCTPLTILYNYTHKSSSWMNISIFKIASKVGSFKDLSIHRESGKRLCFVLCYDYDYDICSLLVDSFRNDQLSLSVIVNYQYLFQISTFYYHIILRCLQVLLPTLIPLSGVGTCFHNVVIKIRHSFYDQPAWPQPSLKLEWMLMAENAAGTNIFRDNKYWSPIQWLTSKNVA
jgi:hypothetical protein